MSERKQRTPEQNSKMMKQIKNSGSKIETMLQKELWHRGLHYRKNLKTVTGKPDICFKGLKIAVFCDSEFWHGYDWENRKEDFKSHRDFWIPKIERNIQRDKEVTDQLESEGWTVLRFWGKDIEKDVCAVAEKIEVVYYEKKEQIRKKV